jgi:heme iron utilization protein
MTATTDTPVSEAPPTARFDPHRDGGMDPQPGIARPSHAERVRTLVHGGGRAMLATIARDPAGHPFGSLTAYVADDDGSPWLLVSTMAEHTANATADARASLLVSEEAPPGIDPLALTRATLIGELMRTDPSATVRERFLERHPGARVYVDFPDFGWWRLRVHQVRYVGGFGRMSWVGAVDYTMAAPDPVAPFAAGIVEHMNADHAGSQVELVHGLLGRTDVEAAVMTGVDRLGVDLDTTSPAGRLPLRIAFPEPATSPEEVRRAIIALLASARAAVIHSPSKEMSS